jgi:hypothetical protein
VQHTSTTARDTALAVTDARKMTTAELLGSHVHETTTGKKVYVWRR